MSCLSNLHRRKLAPAVLASCLYVLSGPGAAAVDGKVPASCMHASPPHRVALVELYTSEGCNSCPPADRWLSRSASRLPPTQAIAMALHVDYWDSLGWRDRFGSPVFTARQRMLAEAAGSRTVYTPEVFVGAREERRWPDAAAIGDRIAAINARPAGAALSAGWQFEGAQAMQLALRAAPAQGSGPLQVYAALVEDGLESAVAAGENQGATLHHDRVVRFWLGPFPVPAQGLAWSGRVPLPAGSQPRKLAWVAFAQAPGGEVAQAVLAPSCEGR